MSFSSYSSGTATETEPDDLKFDDISDNDSYKIEKIQILNEELQRKNEMINKYTQGYPEYEELHMQLREAVSKSKDFEIQNENLKIRLKQSQNQVISLNNQLKETKSDYENKIKQLEDQKLQESHQIETKYKEIINDLQSRLEKCDLEPKVNDFLHEISNTFRNKFNTLDELTNFISQHEDKYQKELENMANQCEKQIQEFQNKIDNLKTRNRILLDEQNEDKTDIANFKRMIKDLRKQLKKNDFNCNQRVIDSDQEIYKLQQANNSLQGLISSLENTCSRLRAQISESENRFQILSSKCENFESQIKKLVKQNSDDAAARIEEQKKSEKTHMAEIDRLSSELRRARDEKSSLESEFRYFADKARSALDQRSSLKEKVATANQKNSELESKIVQMTSELSKMELEKHALEAKISDMSSKQLSIIVPKSDIRAEKTNHDEICRTFEMIILGLKQEITELSKQRDRLAAVLVKQNNVVKRLESTQSASHFANDDEIVDKIWEIVKGCISENERNKFDVTLSSKKLTFTAKIKYIFTEISRTQLSVVADEILAWMESLRRFSTNDEVISSISKFVENNSQAKELKKIPLRESLEKLASEGIASYNALRLISFMHSVCEQQQLELDSIESYRQNFPKLMEKMNSLKERYEKMRTLAKSLRDELSVRLEYEEKLEHEAKAMREKMEHLILPTK